MKKQAVQRTDNGRAPAAESSAGHSAAGSTAAMHRRAMEVRAALLACRETGNHDEFGQLVRAADGTPVAIRLKPERIEDFRCLLSLAKEELGRKRGVPVVLHSAERYEGVDLLISLDGAAGAGKTPERTIISFFKAPPNSPRDAPRHRAPDLMNEVIRLGGDHLVCLASRIAYFNKAYGFEVLAIMNRSPSDTHPGWTEQHDEDYQEEMRRYTVVTGDGDNRRTVKLPYSVMRLNPALHATIRKDGQLSEPSQDYSDLNTFSQVPDWNAGYREIVRMRGQTAEGR